MKNKIHILIILFLITIFQSCSVIGLLQSSKKVSGDYSIELKPQNRVGHYDMSINVIQGIASFENGFFTTQTSANKYLSINFLNEKGESVFDKRFSIVSHGQDLSVEKISENELYLYTTLGHYNHKGASGILRLKVIMPEIKEGKRDMSEIQITIDKEIKLGLSNSTPTLSENKKQFAIRSGNEIITATKEDVLNGDLKKSNTFQLDKAQLSDKGGNTLWFQGIAMKDNKIYCITGNNSLDSPKYLFIYSTDGKVLSRYDLDKNDFAKSVGNKYEPEGITFVGNDLYYTIMAKAGTGGNRKFLFKFNF